MKKKSVYIIVFLIMVVIMVPELMSTIRLESLNKKVICSVKITNINNEIIKILSSKSADNIKHLILNDSFFMDDTSNNQALKQLALSDYKFGISMDLSSKTPEYYESLEDLINKYEIKTLYFEENNRDFDKDTFEKVTNLAKKSGIILGLLENPTQNGLQYSSLTQYSDQLNGITNRASFVNSEDISGLTEEDLKYRLLRSVVDRGIRFLSVEAYDSNSLLFCNNVYGELNKELTSKGYSQIESSPVKTSGSRIFKAVLEVVFSLFQLILFLSVLSIDKKYIKLCAVLFSILTIPALYISYDWTMLILAFSITVTVPSSAAVWIYKNYENIKSLKQIFGYHFLFFAIYILSGCFIWLAMSEFDFRIGFKTYKIALLSFILPFAAILYYTFKNENINLKQIKKALRNKRTIAVTLLTILAVYIYLSRSGNYSFFPASAPELKLRIFLEKTIPVRPRFKEFLIGYPCFFLYFVVDRKKLKAAPIYLLLGASITGISILNTFCHSFTPVNVSIIRSFSGFILGTVTSVTVYFVTRLFYRSALQLRPRYSFPDSRYR